MKVSLKWLKKYIDLGNKVEAREIADRLILSTVEVEGVVNQASLLDNIIVGKVLEVRAHPDADKLKVVMVNDGKDTVQVVCGGSNVTENMLIAFAKIGARVRWHGEGDLVTLEKIKIRGVESFGMICSSAEIGLVGMFEEREGEILDLTEKKLKLGQPLAKALGLDDVIFDIDNKSITNRPDLWGHYGLARELSVLFEQGLKKYETKMIKGSKDINLKVEIKEKNCCRRYMAVVIDNVSVGQSPEWLVKSLQTVGLRSINNIVDITNYILFDIGQPLHAFDANSIKDTKIVVRKAIEGEKLKALDEKEYKLINDDLIIASKSEVVALAGIMGGLDSGITDKTTKIIIESANFEPIGIRKTSARLGLRSDSSVRFEKNLDLTMTETALRKAVELVLQVCPEAKVVSAVVDNQQEKVEAVRIDTNYEVFRTKIGVKIENKVIRDILEKLGFKVKSHGDKMTVTVPSWRAAKDISIAEDLVEEVARVYGYDKIEPTMPVLGISLPEENFVRKLSAKITDIAVTTGATEVSNYAFVSEEQLEKLNLQTKSHITLLNPATEDRTLLRRDLFLGLLQNVADNLRYVDQINIFEVGKVFLSEQAGEDVRPGVGEKLPAQPVIIAGMISSEKNIEPVLQSKQMVEMILSSLDFVWQEVVDSEVAEHLHPFRYLRMKFNEHTLAEVGEVHPEILSKMEIKQKVGFWKINVDNLVKLYERKYNYKPVSRYPGVELDLAITVDENIRWKELKNIVQSTEPNLIKNISLFDIYKSDKIGVGKKSLAFHILYQSEDRTLDYEEVKKWQEKVVGNLEKSVKAKVRKG